jgi:hypothetical protein
MMLATDGKATAFTPCAAHCTQDEVRQQGDPVTNGVTCDLGTRAIFLYKLHKSVCNVLLGCSYAYTPLRWFTQVSTCSTGLVHFDIEFLSSINMLALTQRPHACCPSMGARYRSRRMPVDRAVMCSAARPTPQQVLRGHGAGGWKGESDVLEGAWFLHGC